MSFSSGISSTQSPRKFGVAVLAGGQSRRMGSDKAALLWNAVPALEHICRVAAETGNRVLVVGRERPTNWPLQTEFLLDEERGIGPLGGLKTALQWALARDFFAVLALPCDTPLLTSSALKWLEESSSSPCIVNGFVVRSEEKLQPLFAIYKLSCLSLIDKQIRQNRHSMHAFIEAGEFETVAAPPEIARQLVNLNTPEEWRHAQDLQTLLNHENSLDEK